MVQTFNLEKFKPPKGTRRKAYSLIVYPDSAPDDWIEVLNEYCLAHEVACAISPLHDSDVYESGEKIGLTKKPHYHVLFASQKNIYFSTFSSMASAINQTQGSYVSDLGSAFLYLSHSNAPNKHQYNVDDVLFCGSYESVDFTVVRTHTQNEELYTDLLMFIVTHQITELKFLYSYDSFENFGLCSCLSDYFNLLKKNHVVIRDLITSIRN